jgi:hypothetical protein
LVFKVDTEGDSIPHVHIGDLGYSSCNASIYSVPKPDHAE